MQAKAMAKEVGAAGYISYSALTQENLRFLMDECIKVAILGQDLGSKKQETSGRGCIVG